MTKSKDLAVTVARVVLAVFALAYGGVAVFGEQSAIATHVDASVSESTARALAGLLALAGVSLLLGVLPRVTAGVVIAIVVLHAIQQGRFGAYFERDNGCERALALAALAFVVITHGAGALKLDLGRKQKG
jgi:uncharacterized membrane protein YphA (DoxX/SURF4 family)